MGKREQRTVNYSFISNDKFSTFCSELSANFSDLEGMLAIFVNFGPFRRTVF